MTNEERQLLVAMWMRTRPVSDYGEQRRELRDAKRAVRAKYGVPCPVCQEKAAEGTRRNEMSITETPHAEDFLAELWELFDEYRQRGLSTNSVTDLLKSAIEDLEKGDD